MKTLFVTWQDAETRLWHPVGRLRRREGFYEFAYTRGAQASERFRPFGNMTDLEATYVSEALFPLFENRLMAKSRPEYAEYLSWMGLTDAGSDDLELLARSGGMRATDNLEVFECPSRNPDGHYEIIFFSHGIRHLPQDSVAAVSDLRPGDRLFLLPDPQNHYDADAVVLRTNDPIRFAGYCPRYYARDLRKLLALLDGEDVTATVECVNPDAPSQFRLLCKIRAPWPKDFTACDDEQFQPIGEQADAGTRRHAVV